MAHEAVSSARRTGSGAVEFSPRFFLSHLDPWMASRAFQGVLRRCQLGLSLGMSCNCLFGEVSWFC